MPEPRLSPLPRRHAGAGAVLLGLLLLLAGCGGGGGSGAAAEEAGTASPYSRLVYVDGSHASASDTNPGTAALPYKTINGAMAQLRAGDDVIVAPGVYREWIVVPTTLAGSTLPTRLRAAVAHTVTVKGSTEVGGWSALGLDTWWVPWNGEEPQQVFRAGAALAQLGGQVFGAYPVSPSAEQQQAVASSGELWPGRRGVAVGSMPPDSFYYDRDFRMLTVRLSTPLGAGEVLEVSTRRHVLQAEDASRLTVQGLDFAHANTSGLYRQGAVKVMGSFNLLKDLVVSDMDAACVQLGGSDSRLEDSTVQRCGQLGVLARGLRMAFTGNRITQGNTRGFNKWWEAGGMKLTGTGGLQDSVLRGNVVAYNDGDGIWFDYKNAGNTIEGNTTAYNSGFGIHYEASQTGTIRANLAYGNGQRGIYLLESANCLIEGNAVFANTLEGIAVVDGTRSAADPTLRPVGNQVLGNALAWNDLNSNWVQLVVPGRNYGTASDRNAFKASVLSPRLSAGFVSASNPAFEQLAAWRAALQLDATSTEQTLDMPAALRSALQARQLLQPADLPSFLARPGTF